jgi:hypothetical protein
MIHVRVNGSRVRRNFIRFGDFGTLLVLVRISDGVLGRSHATFCCVRVPDCGKSSPD